MYPFVYTVLTLAFVGILVGLYFVRKNTVGLGGGFLVVGVCAFFGAMIALMLGIVGNENLPKKWSKEYTSVKLVNMRDQAGTSGSFFLGSGGFSSSSYYTYYREERGGGFKKELLNPNNLAGSESEITIFEEARKDGELRIFRLEYAEEWYKFFGKSPVSQRYEFHIPKGSIARGFVLE